MAHDLFYETYNGGILGYFGSHWQLAKCVWATGYGVVAIIMLFGLCTLGTVHLLWKHRANNERAGR